jgi:hypothetical protein
VQDRRRRNGSAPGFPALPFGRIAEPETHAPLRASQSWRAVVMTKHIAVAFAVFALTLGVVRPSVPSAVAEAQLVRVDGLVQWIGGQQMVVQADTGPSLEVDLTSVPQDEYAGLSVRDRVAVFGMVSPDGRRVIGTSIARSERAR